jgi:hypothetical protein
MPRAALVTSTKFPNLTDDDRLLLAPLAERGVQADPVVWDDAAADWSSYDAIVLRSTWDYHLKAEKFLRWIDSLADARAPLRNPPTLVRWNVNKAYLRDLDAEGIAIVPTIWPEAGERVRLREKLRELGWKKAVVKPCISATAYCTQLITVEEADSAQALFDELLVGPGVMIQKFMDSIVDDGEWSLIFFDCVFSHAVLKTAASGDFRVQSDFGGSDRVADPPTHVLEAARRILRAVEPTLYARVDGVVEDSQFHLMELELIEPALFLSAHSAAPERFAGAIARVTVPRATWGQTPSSARSGGSPA